jgi:hypothetical protein
VEPVLRRFVVAVLLAVAQVASLASPAAANSTIEQAAPITAANPTVGDNLIGDSGGAFRYYAIEYPGAGLPVAIVMRAQPGRGTAGVATGFKVYGPMGLFGEAIGDDRSTTDSTYTLTLAHGTPGTYHVQVFNFISGLPLSFGLTVSGLPGAPAAAPADAPGPAAAPPTQSESAQQPSQTTGTSFTTGGLLPANPTGSFAYYDLEYPGGRAKMAITIGYSPIAQGSEQAVGFNLYARDGTLVGTSAESGRNEGSATEVFTLEADDAEKYLLQVFNYHQSASITYTLIVTGLTGPILEVGDLSSPASAVLLSPSVINARGTLVGDRTGRFHYFLVAYPGADREVRLTVTFDAAPVGDQEVGFNIFKDAERAGIAIGNLTSSKGKRVAQLTIKEVDARTFGIQVYNYSPGQAVRYLINVQGL